MNNIIQLATARGSKAATKAGARKFLLGSLPGTIPGFRLNGGGRRAERGIRPTKAQWVAGERRRREEVRGAAICAALGLIVKNEMETQLADQFDRAWPYRRAESRWAGGNHSVHVLIDGTPRASCSTNRVWSRNGKWSGNDSAAHLTITPSALRAFGPEGLIVGGLITLDAEPVGCREFRAVWAKQSRGVGLTEEHGWIIRGYHSTRKTLDAARKEARAARAKAAAAALSVRAKRRGLQTAQYTSVFVSLDDSLAAGNCRPASESVRQRVSRALGGDVYAVRGDVLLGLCTESELARAIRAIETARDRHTI